MGHNEGEGDEHVVDKGLPYSVAVAMMLGLNKNNEYNCPVNVRNML